MGTLTVGSLVLSLRLPGGAQDRAGAVQDVVERRFLPAVLDALACELDAVYGEAAVIRIRRLRVRLRIGPEIRNAADLARQVGQDLAAHIQDIALVAHPGTPPPPVEAEARIWPTAGAWHGAALIAALRDEPGPEGRRDDLPALARTLLDEPPDVVAATLGHCAEAGLLDKVISALPPSVQQTLLARFAPVLPPSIRAAILAVIEGASPEDSAPGDKADPGPARPPAVPARSPNSAEPRPPRHNQVQPPRRRFERRAPDPAAPPGGLPRPVLHPGPAATLPPAPQASGVSTPARPAARAGPDPGTTMSARRAGSIPDIGDAPPPDRIGTDAGPSSAAYPTGWGGLVYLVTLAIRLGIPEALWRIGVPEGSAMAAMLATLSGVPGDPASAALAAEFPRPPAPPDSVPDWARREFCTTITTAARDLAGTDLGARIETRRAALAGDGSWCLSEWGAAALVATLAELIHRPLDAQALTGLLGIAGEVEIGPRLILVRLPSDAVDFDIRRAGLDADPGHLTWLGKRLEIAFGSGEEDWAG
ncbi:hypothetical protein [Paracoccus benzoatiresistens]|uniref:DUF2336 domain-containing protein n=1 Tax=Paracoccus benzoatiresistens TaxID=2997341 RepID=A0ABT4J5W3_9RHOB|nr:hypothetical protein [Paracoccus sp. EF6]MCZ0962497.1 hypothetical protein [Paracoccus sp. EF6]